MASIIQAPTPTSTPRGPAVSIPSLLSTVIKEKAKAPSELIDLLLREVGCAANLDVLRNPCQHTQRDVLGALATIFLGILAIKTRVQLFVSDDETIRSTVSIFERHLDSSSSSSTSPCPVLPYENPALLIDLLESENLPTTTVTNILLHIQLCIRNTNLFAKALQKQNPSPLSLRVISRSNGSSDEHEVLSGGDLTHEVLNFIQFHEVDPNHPFMCGNVSRKEAGAYVYEGSFGDVQIGIPPETIKASLLKGKPVPTVYVLPPRLFSVDAISYGDIEFPIYFNFFIQKGLKKNKVIFVGSQDQLERVQTSFCESIFGPSRENIYIDEDIAPKKRDEGYRVDLPAERNFLAFKDASGKQPPLTHFASFQAWDEKGSVIVNQRQEGEEHEKEKLLTVKLTKGVLRFFDNGELKGILDTSYYNETRHIEIDSARKPMSTVNSTTMPSIFSLLQRTPSLSTMSEKVPITNFFEPPVLGVTFIGTSHGFDPKGITTGFIIWINGNGVLIDPPVQTTDFLRENGIHRRFVNKVILTHCHSDHDSGLIRKILEGEKIEVYTTKTIIESYKRKFNAITGIKDLGEYFIFRQVRIGDPIKIHGASFEFDYAFHTIPTARFKLTYCGKSISYSADCYYSPRAYSKLVQEGIINYSREISLRMFLFDADLIIHESGIPPIHTDLSDLNDLPSSVKKRMCVVHTSNIPDMVERQLEDGKKIQVKVTDLNIPKSGVDNTIVLSVGEFVMGYSKATRLFKIFCGIFYFRHLSPNRLYELFSYLEEERYAPGQVIVQQGEYCEKFYIIENGEVEIYESWNDDARLLLSLSCGDYFGESALQSENEARRLATVIARTSCQLLVVHAHRFREVVSDKLQYSKDSIPIDFDLLRVQRYRPFVREMISKSFLFRSLKSDQIESIAAIIEDEMVYPKGSLIIRQGDTDGSLFLIKEGVIELEKTDPDNPSAPAVGFMRLGPGDTFGEISLITGLPRTASALAYTNATVLELKRDLFRKLINKFQNIRYSIISVVEQRIAETRQVDKHVHRLLSHPNLLMSLRPTSPSAPASPVELREVSSPTQSTPAIPSLPLNTLTGQQN